MSWSASGEIAALATAVSWGISAVWFGDAARRIGADRLNLLRLVLASALLAGLCVALGTRWSLPGPQAALLALSGLVGLVLGDAAYFRALAILGPRRAALLMSLAPILTALLAGPLLSEYHVLGLAGWCGVALTLGGVLWVQAARSEGGEIHGDAKAGLVFGILGALGQAAGFLLSKAGLGSAPDGGLVARLAGLPVRAAAAGEEGALAGESVDALYGTLIRMAASTAILVAWSLAGRGPGRLREALRDGPAMRAVAAGAVTGPVIGVWLALYSVKHAASEVASTIIASYPVFVMASQVVLRGERVPLAAWGGAALALAGVALLSFR